MPIKSAIPGLLCTRAAACRFQLFASALLMLSMLVIPCQAQAIDMLTMNTTAKPPLSTEFNDGFIDLLVIEAMSRIQVKIKIVQLPAERALQDANAGILDGEILRVAGLEKLYPNLISVDEKLMDLEFMAFSRTVQHLNAGWSSLKPYSIAFMNGWKILEHNVPKDAEITKVNSHSQLFNLLDINRVDLAIYERWGGLHLVKDLNISNVHAIEPALAISPMLMYLNKSHSALIPKLDKALKDMKADGTYNKIYASTLMKYQDKQIHTVN
jgi:polar amino acid transport system substrate-binding protein